MMRPSRTIVTFMDAEAEKAGLYSDAGERCEIDMSRHGDGEGVRIEFWTTRGNVGSPVESKRVSATLSKAAIFSLIQQLSSMIADDNTATL